MVNTADHTNMAAMTMALSASMKNTADKRKASPQLVRMLRTYASLMSDTSEEADAFFTALKEQLRSVLQENNLHPPEKMNVVEITPDTKFLSPPLIKRQKACDNTDCLVFLEAPLRIGIVWRATIVTEECTKARLACSEILIVEVTPETRAVAFTRVVMPEGRKQLVSAYATCGM